MLRPLLLSAGLLFGHWAFGASPVDEARAQSEAPLQAINDLRRRQMSLRNELNRVAAQIEMLKAKKAKSKALKEALLKSVELSNALTALTRELTQREQQSQTADKQLLSALNGEWKKLRQAFDQESDATKRRDILSQLKRLRSERDRVRQRLPKEAVPEAAWAEVSQDAEALLEEADALKDREAKVRNQLKELENRIAEAREERELARRMSDFMGDEALFDDQDRRLRLTQATPAAEPANFPTVEAGSEGNGTLGASSSPPASSGSDMPTASGSASFISGSDARPVVGNKIDTRLQENDDLESLLSQKEQLKQLAEEMKTRAQKLEQQARDAE